MNQKGIAPIVIVVVVVAVIGVAGGAVLLTRGGGTGTAGSVASASSLQFSIDATVQGQSVTSTVYMKNIGTSNLKIRSDSTVMGQQIKMIIDTGADKIYSWTSVTGWVEIPYSASYEQQFTGYTGQISGLTGGEFTYTDPTSGATIRMYNIQVNPTLADSLFQTS
jgi:hypothetical protein